MVFVRLLLGNALQAHSIFNDLMMEDIYNL